MDTQFRIAEIRKARRYKQREVADKLGVSLSTYRNWEYEATTINLDWACKLADLFECSIDELAGREHSTSSKLAYINLCATEIQRCAKEIVAQSSTRIPASIDAFGGTPKEKETLEE